MKKNKTIRIAAIIVSVVVLLILGILLGIKFFSNSSVGTDNTLGVNNTEVSKEPLASACTYLSKEIAEQVLQEKVRDPDDNSSSICTYITDTTNMEDLGILTLVISGFNSSNAKQSFEAAKSSNFNNSYEDVSGLEADGAYYANSSEQLNILKGNKWLIVAATSSKYQNDKEAATAAAKLILPNVK